MKGSMDMGYYVELEEADFKIPETPEVLAALKAMPAKYKEVQRGGSFGGGGTQEKWFSWIDDKTILDSPTVSHIFEALGFETDTIDGFVHLNGYSSKVGQEDLFLATVSPFMAEGSYTEWKGEDDARYKYIVKDGALWAAEGKATPRWNKAKPLMIQHFVSERDCKEAECPKEFHYHVYDAMTMTEVKVNR
jgi:hypothetical protein